MDLANRLKEKGLRITDGRISILDFFQKNPGLGLSIHDLLGEFSGDLDKVTLYRTLHSFEEKGLIHKVIDETGLERYALCEDHCHDDHGHNHEHIHFKCVKCQKTECLDDSNQPKVSLPAGYSQKEANFLILGECARCNEKAGK
ncbi:Fur family transcriptional regulator [Wandonia haliotis]|uniref:Fur family transcriptional regulator n=1 Tax=Wandonia haliotis TaxID=574963 RepID=A0ABN1MSY8_9FLAO